MNHPFFHERRAEIIKKHQAELAKFDSEEAEFNVVHNILADVLSEYPGIYTWHSTYYATIQIPESMSIAEFNDWLDYLEAEYLADYDLVRNDVHGSIVIADYKHKETNKVIHLEFSITQCRTIQTMEYKPVYKADCHWE